MLHITFVPTDPVSIDVDGLHFEIYSDGGRLIRIKSIVGEPQEEARLADSAFAND